MNGLGFLVCGMAGRTDADGAQMLASLLAFGMCLHNRSLESGWDKTVVPGGKPLKLKVRMRVYKCTFRIESSGRLSLTIITNHPPLSTHRCTST